jgi:murein DD-endopeptidase MepM/ murein hydrolase activator NlpD
MRLAALVRATLPALVLLAACGGGGDGAGTAGTPVSPPPSTSVADTATPQLVDLGVTFAPYDSATGRAGAFAFSRTLRAGPLGPFGRTVSDPNGNPKTLPELDYFVPEGTVVRAPFDGVVSWVRRQADTQDYEMLVHASARSPWWFDYDHVAQVLVDSGRAVRAGDPVAVVGSRGMTELMVGNDRTQLVYCPLALAHPARADSLAAAVTRLMSDWERWSSERPFDPAAMPKPGCLGLSAPSY